MATAKILYKSFYWKILQFLASFVINIIFARTLRSAVSAEFYSLLYLLSLGVAFFTLGLDIGLNFFLSRKEISSRYACSIILIVVILALAICLPLIYLLYQPSWYPDLSLKMLLVFSACNIGGGLLTTLSGTLFTAYGQNYLPAKLSFIANIIMMALSLAVSLKFSGSKGVESLFILYFVYSFLQGLFLFILAIRLYAGKGPEKKRKIIGIGHLLQFSLAAFITNFIFFLGSRMCLYLLPYRAGPANQGNYILAYKIVEYLCVMTAFIYYPFITLVAGENREKMNEMVLFLVRLSNTMVLIFSIFALTAGWYLFPFVFGKSFDGMYGIFIWFIPGLFAACSSTFFTAYYFGIRRIKYNFISACIQLVSAPILFFLLTWVRDIQGAALAFSLAAIVSTAYDCFIFKRYADYRMRDLLFASKKDWYTIRLFITQLLK